MEWVEVGSREKNNRKEMKLVRDWEDNQPYRNWERSDSGPPSGMEKNYQQFKTNKDSEMES